MLSVCMFVVLDLLRGVVRSCQPFRNDIVTTGKLFPSRKLVSLRAAPDLTTLSGINLMIKEWSMSAVASLSYRDIFFF